MRGIKGEDKLRAGLHARKSSPKRIMSLYWKARIILIHVYMLRVNCTRCFCIIFMSCHPLNSLTLGKYTAQVGNVLTSNKVFLLQKNRWERNNVLWLCSSPFDSSLQSQKASTAVRQPGKQIIKQSAVVTVEDWHCVMGSELNIVLLTRSGGRGLQMSFGSSCVFVTSKPHRCRDFIYLDTPLK